MHVLAQAALRGQSRRHLPVRRRVQRQPWQLRGRPRRRGRRAGMSRAARRPSRRARPAQRRVHERRHRGHQPRGSRPFEPGGPRGRLVHGAQRRHAPAHEPDARGRDVYARCLRAGRHARPRGRCGGHGAQDAPRHHAAREQRVRHRPAACRGGRHRAAHAPVHGGRHPRHDPVPREQAAAGLRRHSRGRARHEPRACEHDGRRLLQPGLRGPAHRPHGRRVELPGYGAHGPGVLPARRLLVDSAAARENVTRFAEYQGYAVGVAENDGEWTLTARKA